MPSTHTADFQTAALKATDLEAVEKINVGLETELARKQLNIIADAPEIRIQDKTGSAPEVNATTMAIVADGGATHFRAGTTTFAEGTETKGNVKFQSSTGATTHAEIVGSSGTLELQDGGLALKLGSNVSVTGTSKVIQEITGPHARESAVLKKYPEVPLASNVQSGYTVTASNASDTRPVWQVFDGSNATLWGTNGGAYNSGNPGTVASSGSYPGEIITLADSTQHDRGHWMKIKFPHKVRLSSYHISAGSADRRPASISILGSNDDSNWYIVKDVHSVGSEDRYTIEISASTAYRYALLLVHSIVGSDNQMVIDTIEYHGYEDVGAGDDSVDTTVKSVYNAPDLTSAALYIDATKPDSNESVTDQSGSGVTVTAVGVTHDSTENAWELTGAATSNIVSGNLASLVGDHPHSVSAWVKADVLNGDGLFHVGTAEGEGDAASRVGFVDDSHISYGGADHFFSNAEWHNVTYTYNGEGSDKKLYLDGRLVDTAKNEDTFGDYPPFAMSTYSEYGYTVSASSELAGGGYLAWEAFDDTTGGTSGGGGAADQAWISADSTYTGSTYHSTKNLGTDHGGSATTSGEYLILELPHKLILSCVEISPRGSSADRAPRDGKVYGSNDKVNWTEIGSFTGLAHSSGSYASVVVNANSGFKMFAIVTTAILNSVTSTWLGIGELKYYGHRENDLVRFPDSVNVLKYPHVAMTGPAQRGYVVSGSSEHSSEGNIYSMGLRDGHLFDEDPTTVWHAETNGTNDYRYDRTGYRYGLDSVSNFDPAGINIKGEWVQLKFPHKLKISKVHIRARAGNEDQAPEDFAFYGSDTAAAGSWTLIQSFTGESPQDDGTSYYDITSNPSHYKYILMLITRLNGTTALSMASLQYYGTESGDVVARVGDGFDGKIRNLRVFSTALSDARVQEIFDADKDEFGLAKSSVSVYRGRLGVGTTEPEGRFAVLDEAGEMGEFPPKPMMAAETYMEGHGNFKACASSYYGTNPSLYQPYAGFKRSADPTTQWNINTWNSISPSYSAATKQVTSGASLGGYAGEWLKLSLPYGVKLGGYQIMIRSDWADYGPEDWVIIGSNDDTTWHLIASVTAGGIGSSSGDFAMTKDFIVETTKYYKHLALVCSAIHGGVTQVNFTGLRYFGTRERGQSTLHDGSLTLTKNLTVPRIGPALDADDTPRRDRLVVEYNTSTNPTANGTVKDTSGRGNDGLFYGGASYDATEKALVFDGTDDYIEGRLNNTGDFDFSVSVWVKRSTDTTDEVFFMGEVSNGSGAGLQFKAISDGSLFFYSYAGPEVDYTTGGNEADSNWVHLVAVRVGGDRKLYFNGEYIPLSIGGASTQLSFGSNVTFRLGARTNNGNPLNGSISNFKLYDVALTATEVKRLYDMGRLGNVIAQPVHIAAPLYAPGTIVQVESSTKYDTFSATGLNTHPLSPGNDVPGLSVTIHPKFANSKILISYDVNMGSYGRAYLRIQRTQGGNVTAIEAPIGPAGSTTEGKSTSSTVFGSTTNSEVRAASFTHYDDANSIVPITYQIQAWTYHSTYYVYINRAHQDHDGTTNNSTYWARTLSSITAKEVCQ